MDELFFGAKKKKKTKHSPRRKRSPTRMCNKKLSLAKLRKLAVEHSVDIFSKAKRSVNKRTGELKKPKMVGCSTLMKRLNEAGLSHLYKVREVRVTPEVMPYAGPYMYPLAPSDPLGLGVYDRDCSDEFDEYISSLENPEDRKKMRKRYVGYARGNGPCSSRKLVRLDGTLDSLPKFDDDSKYTPPHVGPCGENQILVDDECLDIVDLERGKCIGDKLLWHTGYNKCLRLKPRKVKVPTYDPSSYPGPSGHTDFSMVYGRRYMSGSRPKKTHKHVGVIEVKGRAHHVFRGENGGLFYLKGKKGTKVYIDKERLKKRK